MIITSNIEEAKKQIKNEKRPIIVLAHDEVFNRKILERGGFDILLSPEKNTSETTVRQLYSGLNEIIARIAKKNNISIGIDLKEINSLDKKEKAVRLEKIRQNILVCRKTGTKIKMIPPNQSLMISLGASTSQAKESSQPF